MHRLSRVPTVGQYTHMYNKHVTYFVLYHGPFLSHLYLMTFYLHSNRVSQMGFTAL